MQGAPSALCPDGVAASKQGADLARDEAGAGVQQGESLRLEGVVGSGALLVLRDLVVDLLAGLKATRRDGLVQVEGLTPPLVEPFLEAISDGRVVGEHRRHVGSVVQGLRHRLAERLPELVGRDTVRNRSLEYGSDPRTVQHAVALASSLGHAAGRYCDVTLSAVGRGRQRHGVVRVQIRTRIVLCR